MWKRIKTHFRRHTFDMSNPLWFIVCGHKFSLFRCKHCHKTLALDRDEMEDLPWAMGRGCPGKVE